MSHIFIFPLFGHLKYYTCILSKPVKSNISLHSDMNGGFEIWDMDSRADFCIESDVQVENSQILYLNL